MLRSKLYLCGVLGVVSFLPMVASADNAWGGYRGVERHHYHPQTASPAYKPDPFAFSNQRYTPTAPPQGYYYQQNQYERYPYGYSHRYQPSVRIEYYPDTQYDYQYQNGLIVGSALPSEFRQARYVLRDWNRYSLDRPPYGRHWVIADGRYLLVTDDHFMIEIIR